MSNNLQFGAIRKIVQTIKVEDFTDNTDTTGYLDLTEKLPIGAIPQGWKIKVTEAFAGDTSAVIQAGIAGDLDRFTADATQSIFTTGVKGSLPLAADAGKSMSALTTIRLTVTGAVDFGAISGGEGVFEFFYAI